MTAEVSQRTLLRGRVGTTGHLSPLGLNGEGVGGGVRERRDIGGEVPHSDGGISGSGEDGGAGSGDGFNRGGVPDVFSDTFDGRGIGHGVAGGVGPCAEGTVEAAGDECGGGDPARGFDGGGVAGGLSNDRTGEVPYSCDAVVGAGKD